MLAHRTPHHFGPAVIPGLAKREPGIHQAVESVEKWIPGSCYARPGMTNEHQATIFSNTPINASGAVTFGAWLASSSK